MGIRSERVLAAFGSVPRWMFVPEPLRHLAEADRPLPIGDGQTISQPYMVAYMAELLDLAGGERVLEVGTGSGYETAILARLAGEVFSVEILESLLAQARGRLAELGSANVHLRLGDGGLGWPEQAPFDRIVVAAAAPAIPPALLDQLAAGGLLVLPVGPPQGPQSLRLVRRRERGEVDDRPAGEVSFVPLRGAHGHPRQ
jgi:protein-L-isoaspartate(D-aspartate) O-methyltransferase